MADPGTNIPMVNEVAICNLALTWLGAAPISSLNDSIKTAAWMSTNYAHVRDAVLEARMWTFTLKREYLESNDLDPWSQQFVYNIPSTWLGVYRCFRSVYPQKIQAQWTVEGNQILSDSPAIYVWGQVRVTDTGKYSAMFVQALAARLACDACIPLTENRQLQDDLWTIYNKKLQDAATRDNQQGRREKLQSDSLILARAR